MHCGGSDMLEDKGNNSSTLVTAIFCEPFSIARTISALLRGGFADRDIHAFGALEGRIPELRALLLAIGVPSNVVDVYRDCLDEGALLLTVRVSRGGRKKQTVVELVEHYGGVCTPSKSSETCTFSDTTENQIQ
jgi:hypothetical protein